LAVVCKAIFFSFKVFDGDKSIDCGKHRIMKQKAKNKNLVDGLKKLFS
jgi:hypothetical protein